MPVSNAARVRDLLIPCAIGQNPQVVLPKAVLRKLGLVEGDFLRIVHGEQRAAKGSARASTKLAADDRLTAAEARKLRHGLAQARQGKTRPWRDIKHELDL
jgi:bifunctional DNA-binding transcriptional regulator/antitoxin component of YhaV-PrlF toxin-antitoxin module